MKLFMLLQKFNLFLLGFILELGKGIASESFAGVREHKKWTTDMDV